MTRRSAPRQRVVEVWRTGSGYGTTLWHHRLECGHVEVRKRRAPAPQIGCVRCEAGGQAEAVGPLTPVNDEASFDAEVAVLRARLAGVLGVPPDTVSIQVDGARVAGALVLLGPRQIADLLD